MKKLIQFILLAFLSANWLPTASADAAPELDELTPTIRWVGCGISKKAYLVALAKAYEKKTGIVIDVQGGGATRGIREVATMSADMGGSCRRRIFSAKEERGITQVPVAWDALVVIVHHVDLAQDIRGDTARRRELSVTGPGRTPLAHKDPGAGEHLHPRVAGIDDIDEAAITDRYAMRDLLLENRDSGFVNVSALAGAYFERRRVSRACAAGDYDDDGDLDLVVTAMNGDAVLLRNDRSGGHWIGFRLVGQPPNRDAIGARLHLTAGGRTRRLDRRGRAVRAAKHLWGHEERGRGSLRALLQVEGSALHHPAHGSLLSGGRRRRRPPRSIRRSEPQGQRVPVQAARPVGCRRGASARSRAGRGAALRPLRRERH